MMSQAFTGDDSEASDILPKYYSPITKQDSVQIDDMASDKKLSLTAPRFILDQITTKLTPLAVSLLLVEPTKHRQISSGSEVTNRKLHGETILCDAVQMEYSVSTIHLLLSYNAAPNDRNEAGYTPFQTLASLPMKSCILEGYTLQDLQLKAQARRQVAKPLITFKADPLQTNNFGRTDKMIAGTTEGPDVFIGIVS